MRTWQRRRSVSEQTINETGDKLSHQKTTSATEVANNLMLHARNI